MGHQGRLARAAASHQHRELSRLGGTVIQHLQLCNLLFPIVESHFYKFVNYKTFIFDGKGMGLSVS